VAAGNPPPWRDRIDDGPGAGHREGGEPMTPETRTAILAGLVGTAALTLALALGPSLGAPAVNLPLWDGTFFTLNLTWAVAFGYVVHFTIGVLLALVFQRRLRDRLSGEPWLRGAVFGLLVWAVLMVVGLPLFDVLDPLVSNGLLPSPGFFALGLGPTAPVMLLAAHLIYGAVVGSIAGRPAWSRSLSRMAR
jgi:hypothetical protein